MVKLSDEDAALLYGCAPREVADRLVAAGIDTVLLTHGSGGAGVVTRSGVSLSVPIARGHGAVVDTMGAGDATLATVLRFILVDGMPATHQAWMTCL